MLISDFPEVFFGSCLKSSKCPSQASLWAFSKRFWLGSRLKSSPNKNVQRKWVITVFGEKIRGEQRVPLTLFSDDVIGAWKKLQGVDRFLRYKQK